MTYVHAGLSGLCRHCSCMLSPYVENRSLHNRCQEMTKRKMTPIVLHVSAACATQIVLSKKKPDIPQGLPAGLHDMLFRCFAYQPADRPSASEALRVCQLPPCQMCVGTAGRDRLPMRQLGMYCCLCMEV